jgi:hypothetical protein
VVNPAVLTVAAASSSIVYGAALPTYSAGISGYVNSKDTGVAVMGAPVLTTSPAVPSSAAGSYPIIVSKGTLTASNYAFALINGTLTIGKATTKISGIPITVASGQQGSIPITFAGQYTGTGIALPSGTASYTIASPTSKVATGTLTLASGSASVSVPSTLAGGSYTVTVSYGGNSNYSAATGPDGDCQASLPDHRLHAAQFAGHVRCFADHPESHGQLRAGSYFQRRLRAGNALRQHIDHHRRGDGKSSSQPGG